MGHLRPNFCQRINCPHNLVNIYTYICIYLSINIYIYIYTHKHTHTHTHTDMFCIGKVRDLSPITIQVGVGVCACNIMLFLNPKLFLSMPDSDWVQDYAFYSFPADSFKKYKIKTNPKMCILMYFKIQSDQPRTTRLITLKFKVHQDAPLIVMF